MKLVAALLLFYLNAFGQAQFDAAASASFQKNLNAEFADPKESPLTKEDLKSFKGLDFYPIDEKYVVKARLEKSSGEKPFEMKTTTDRKPMYAKYGTAYFSIDGKPLKLNIYRNLELSEKEGYADYLFLPFSDLTNGKETYIGGRYIELSETSSDEILIDFNRAFNPYCAYNYRYSCPIVPLENDLDIEIRAGVKKFHD